MKTTLHTLILIVASLALGMNCVSCFNASGVGWQVTAFGTNAKHVHAGPDGVDVDDMDNATVLKEIVRLGVRYITMVQAVKLLENGVAYLKELNGGKLALYKAGTDRQIGLIDAKSAAEIAKIKETAAAAEAAKAATP